MKRVHEPAVGDRRQQPRRTRHAPGAETLAQAALAVHDVILRRALRRRGARRLRRSAAIGRRCAPSRSGTLRWYLRLAPALEPLVNRPFDELSPQLAALLVTAAHQVEYSRGAAEAQVHLAVDASRVFGEGRASGMVNAVLRRFVAQRAELLAAADADLAQRHAHPRWLVDALADGLGRARRGDPGGQQRASAHGAAASIPRSCTVEDFLRSWRALGREARAVDWNAEAVVLERPVAVQILPGFETGAVSVQDCGAQLAAPLLDAQPGMRVLDACAAPGGKTLHIAQRTPALAELVAVDRRCRCGLQRVRENLERARREALLMTADLRTVPPSLAPDVLRSRAGGCALFGHRRDPPPSGHQAVAPAERHRILRGHPAADSRHRFRTTAARRTSDLLHLFGDAGGERGGGRGLPGAQNRAPLRRAWPEGLTRPPGLHRSRRSAGSCCPVAVRAPMASTMPVSLSYPHNKPRGTNAVPSRA